MGLMRDLGGSPTALDRLGSLHCVRRDAPLEFFRGKIEAHGHDD
jgi:hypothetical protein